MLTHIHICHFKVIISQHVLAGTPVKKWIFLLEWSFIAHMPFLTATNTTIRLLALHTLSLCVTVSYTLLTSTLLTLLITSETLLNYVLIQHCGVMLIISDNTYRISLCCGSNRFISLSAYIFFDAVKTITSYSAETLSKNSRKYGRVLT